MIRLLGLFGYLFIALELYLHVSPFVLAATGIVALLLCLTVDRHARSPKTMSGTQRHSR